MSEPMGLSRILDSVLRTMGAGDVSVWRRIESEWAELAGEPWATVAKPLGLKGTTLIVEAVSPAAVSLLKYGSAGLISSLGRALDEVAITEVRIRPPTRPGAG